jgi:hypothetical protein
MKTHASTLKHIRSRDPLQPGYRYALECPTGKKFDPRFEPDLPPPQHMLALGVFGGVYLDECAQEFPREWFAHAKLNSHGVPDASLNYFGVAASQSRAEWLKRGWVRAQDPRGWFQWYCRYYLGRRSSDDDRQIRRWIAMRRHIGQIKAHCLPGDESCRPKQRQALLHWAYDSRKL